MRPLIDPDRESTYRCKSCRFTGIPWSSVQPGTDELADELVHVEDVGSPGHPMFVQCGPCRIEPDAEET